MQRFISVRLFCSVLLFVGGRLPADPVADYLQAQMAEHRIPGLALTVLRHGERIRTLTYGWADVEQQVPVRPETVFEIGSLTKQFTAAGILLLVQDHQLSVDDRINLYLPDPPPSWSAITIRHLLTHGSGIRSYTGLTGFELTRHLTQTQFIAALRDLPLDFVPGTAYAYCNSGYSLLGYIIENVSGTNYWSFMRTRIFQPLEMHATTDRLPRTIIPHRAHGYEQTNRVWINRDYDLTDIFAAGAIVSTLGDLARWSVALDGEQLLSATSKTAMWTAGANTKARATQYGFGWSLDRVAGHRVIGHGGSTSGFSASHQRFPDDDLVVIVLTNTDEQIATTLARKVATFYFQE
ncbi:MAG TPA: serine hydrolase domain-containing protein [Verrucomicrobiota bacterium]|nr:serine hydrolase domain-containing protein [Verrucomicrobiota bacterium]HNT14578.1 serine hydrolase domain-containing protein [Verrucomicrobiota bacterium]